MGKNISSAASNAFLHKGGIVALMKSKRDGVLPILMIYAFREVSRKGMPERFMTRR